MAHPMIENSDRGITLNKSLAWTALVALVSLVWWGGVTITTLQASQAQIVASIQEIQRQQDRDGEVTTAKFSASEQKISANDARIRGLEQLTARTGAQYESLAQSLLEVKELLRQIVQDKRK